MRFLCLVLLEVMSLSPSCIFLHRLPNTVCKISQKLTAESMFLSARVKDEKQSRLHQMIGMRINILFNSTSLSFEHASRPGATRKILRLFSMTDINTLFGILFQTISHTYFKRLFLWHNRISATFQTHRRLQVKTGSDHQRERWKEEGVVGY